MFFRRTNDQISSLLDRARRIGMISKIVSTSQYIPFGDDFHCLRSVDTEDWDFFLTIGQVFIAMSVLEQRKLDTKIKVKIQNEVSISLSKQFLDASEAFEDCKVFFEAEYIRLKKARNDTTFVSSDALGLWLFWNVVRRAPTEKSEVECARALGGVAIDSVTGYWDRFD